MKEIINAILTLTICFGGAVIALKRLDDVVRKAVLGKTAVGYPLLEVIAHSLLRRSMK